MRFRVDRGLGQRRFGLVRVFVLSEVLEGDCLEMGLCCDKSLADETVSVSECTITLELYIKKLPI